MYRLLASAALSFALVTTAQAVDQPGEITIRADNATLNQTTGVAFYQGAAELHQDNRHLQADSIRIELKNGEPALIEAEGDPVTLEETGTLTAHGKRLVYDVAAKRIQIFDQAYVNHQGRTFEGAELDYDLTSKQVKARGGDDGGRVKLVIPAEQTE